MSTHFEYRRNLHLFFFPFLAQGHMIPMIDVARLFASRGVKATIVTTPLNAPLISKALANPKAHSYNDTVIHIKTINFPTSAESGLPEGCENGDSLPSPNLTLTFFKATTMLQEPLENLLEEYRPDCVVADMFFPWATDSTAKFGIPRLVFHGTCFFTLCAAECMRLYQPYDNVSSDSDPFVIPNLPGEVSMTSMQLPDFFKKSDDTILYRLLVAAIESELTSYGVLVNSFYELEEHYADHYTKVLGRKAWHVGPVSLCNMDADGKANRGREASIDKHECLRWLDTKKPNSVVYVCFGSVAQFPESQLREIAMGLEASGQHFIWVVRKTKKGDQDTEEWLPEGFETRMEGKGLIIRGWAPQVLILEHEAIGVFVSHCGWNSTLEAVCAGVPMVTWPINGDQFFNDKFVTEVLKIGVPVGVKKWVRFTGDSIKWDAIDKAVREAIEAEAMREKAKEYAKKARRAVEKGGSSFSNLDALIDELTLSVTIDASSTIPI